MKYYLNPETERIEVTEGRFLPAAAMEVTLDKGITASDYNNDKNAGRNKYIIKDKVVKLRPLTPKEIAEKEASEAQAQEATFKANFIQTPLGWYRKQPKGFANAPQSWDVIDKLAVDGISAEEVQSIVFYTAPDFTDSSQCTEEWLTEHSYHPEPMSTQEWAQFHQAALLAWVQSEYGGNDFEKS